MDADGRWQHTKVGDYDLQYFNYFVPEGRIGYSLHVYHISTEEANRVRHMLQLREL